MGEPQWPQQPSEADEWLARAAQQAHAAIAQGYDNALAAVEQRQSLAQSQLQQRGPSHRRE